MGQFEQDVANGAAGLKIFKSLGMYVTDSNGRVPTNDPRIDPIWAKAGELGVPVLIHTADPAPFWQPRDSLNERWLELKQRPRRMRPPQPSFETLMGEQFDVFRKHPGTNFISAHMAWMANDLERLGELLDTYPNMYVEMGAVLAEIGRQPFTARQFLIDHQDRVLFGKDSWAPAEYHVYFRVLETSDQYFDYYRARHAHWKLYGVELPDDVLKKIYYKNAIRIVPGIDASGVSRVGSSRASPAYVRRITHPARRPAVPRPEGGAGAAGYTVRRPGRRASARPETRWARSPRRRS